MSGLIFSVTPKGFEPLSEEPESSILSIKLRGRSGGKNKHGFQPNLWYAQV